MEKRSVETPEKRLKGGGKSKPGFPKAGMRRAEPVTPVLNLEYFREARLFLSEQRATLTFFAEQEVASIHYDMLRDEIFYKGHNVKNMTLLELQIEALQKFSEYLAQVPQAQALRNAYLACLERVLPRQLK